MEATLTPSSASSSPDPGPGTNAREAILRTEHLTKRFGQRTAVNNLALDVRRGDVFGLLGPNGSGKTTTLRMVLGLIWPTNGEIVLFGERMTSASQRIAALRRIGAIVEQPAFYPFLSGRENLIGMATFAGLPKNAATRARVEEVLKQVGLADRARDAYKKYSLGMKQRLGIAAALLTDPELVVLDEPTNGLDPAGMVEVRGLISQLNQRGITIVLSSHLLHEVQQVCTRVAILKEGTLLAQGEVSALLAASSGIQCSFAQLEQLPQAAGILLAAKNDGASWIRDARYAQPDPGVWAPPGGWLLQVDAPVERGAEINALLAAHGIYAAEIRRHEGNLEHYFLTLTGGGQTMPQTLAPQLTQAAPGGQS